MAELALDTAISPDRVLAALEWHVGAGYGATARALAYELTGTFNAAAERRLRQVVELLRTRGHRVCAHPTHGYFLAANDAELDETCEFLFSRAMTSLRQVAALKRLALPDLRGQLNLNLNPETQP